MKRRFTVALFVLLLAFALVFTAAPRRKKKRHSAAAPAPAPAVAAKAAVDKDAVLMAAAKDYFAQLATGNNLINAADLKQMLTDNPDALFLVDIRRAADFEAGHIEGAYHSEWADLGKVLEKIPTNRQVVVICYSGQTAGQALGALKLAGFNAKSLLSGMNAWKDEPTVTGMNALSSRNNVSSPKGEEQEILWEAVRGYFASVGKDGNKLIKSQDLYDALEANPKAFKVIDIRGEKDFNEGHVIGSGPPGAVRIDSFRAQQEG